MPALRNPRNAREVRQYGAPALLVGVIGPDEVRVGLAEVAEGADAAAAHGVEDAEAAGGAAVDGGGEDGEIAAGGALGAEERAAGVEFEAALEGLVVSFVGI